MSRHRASRVDCFSNMSVSGIQPHSDSGFFWFDRKAPEKKKNSLFCFLSPQLKLVCWMTLYIYALWRHNKLQVDCVIRLIPAEHASRQLARPLSVGDRNYSHRRKKERKKRKQKQQYTHTRTRKKKKASGFRNRLLFSLLVLLFARGSTSWTWQSAWPLGVNHDMSRSWGESLEGGRNKVHPAAERKIKNHTKLAAVDERLRRWLIISSTSVTWMDDDTLARVWNVKVSWLDWAHLATWRKFSFYLVSFP